MGTFIAIGEKIINEAEKLTAEVLGEIENVAQEALEKVNALIEAHKASTNVTQNENVANDGPVTE